MADELKPWEKAAKSKSESTTLTPWEQAALKKKLESKGSESGSQPSTDGFGASQGFPLNGNNPEIPTVLIGDAKKEAQGIVDRRKESLTNAVNAYKAANPKAKPNATKKNPDGGVGASFMSGLNNFNEGLLKTPKFIYDLASSPQNFIAEITNTPELRADYDVVSGGTLNPLGAIERLGDYYGENKEAYQAKVEKYDKGVFESIKSGNIKDAAEQVLNNIAQSAPSIAGMYLTGGAGNAAKLGQVGKTFVTAMPFASSKNAEIADNQEIPTWLKPIYSTFHGLSEVVYDQAFGSKAILDNVIDTFEREGKEAALKVTKEFVSSYITKAVKKVQPITSTIKNSIEEMTTQLSQNMLTKGIENPDLDLMEGVIDAGITGGATGAGISTIGGVTAGIFNSKQKTKLVETVNRRSEIVDDLDNDNLPDTVKEELATELERVNDSITKQSEEAESKLESLPEKERLEARDLQATIAEVESSLSDESLSESSREKLTEYVSKLQDKLDVLVEASDILNKPDTEESLTKEFQQAEETFKRDGDQTAFDNDMANIEARVQALKESNPQIDEQLPTTTETTESVLTEPIESETAQVDTEQNDTPSDAEVVQEEQIQEPELPIVTVGLNLDNGVNTGLVQNSKGAVYRERDLFKLSSLGYSEAEIDNLSQNEVSQILEKNIENPNVESTAKVKPKGKFQEKLAEDIKSQEVSESMTNLGNESDRGATPEQLEYNAILNERAMGHGRDIIEGAKEDFGDTYVTEVLDYVRETNLNADVKSLALISLENDLHKRLLDEPQNEAMLLKQLKVVEQAALKHQRESARGTQYGIFRRLSRVGYDIDAVTDSFYDKDSRKSKAEITKAIEATTEDIQKQAEQESEFDEVVLERPTGAKLIQAQAELDKAKEDFRKAIRRSMGQMNSGGALNIIGEATNLMRAYAKLGIVKIEDVLKEVAKDFGEKFTTANEEILRDAHKEASTKQPKTPEELLETAKNNLRERIKEKEQHIDDKKVELKARDKKYQTDDEYKSLEKELKHLTDLEKQYLTKDSKDLLDERKKASIVTKLENEIEKLDSDIANEEKTATAKGQPLSNDKITDLKAQKQARMELLEQIDPTVKTFVKEALIEAGYGKEVKVKGKPSRIVLDWNKLAGITSIKDVVNKVLAGNTDISAGKKLRMVAELEAEYNRLHAEIIQRGINDLNARNQVVNPDTKTLATRISELYNKGLFNKNPDTYDYLINKTFGTSIKDQELFFKIKDLARTLSITNSFKIDGSELTDLAKSTLSIETKAKIKDLLHLVVAQNASADGFKGNVFRATEVIKQLLGMSQRQLLVSVKQAIENPISNKIDDVYRKLQDGFKTGKWDTKALEESRKFLAKNMFNNIQIHGGSEYGGTANAFTSRNQMEQWVATRTSNEIYQAVTNLLKGTPFLDSADSASKIRATELEFTHNLLRILTDKTNKNRMSQEDALAYVSENLTGQSKEDATKTAIELIASINKQIGRTIISEHETNVARIANDIMKDALVKGGKISADEVKAAFDAAYITAGTGKGHEANNPISRGVNALSRDLQTTLDESIKRKEWGKAAKTNMQLILVRNMINPFVGGGTNWTILGLQKAGLPIHYLSDLGVSGNKKIDLSTTEGMKDLSRTLTTKANIQRANGRTLIGLSVQLAALGLGMAFIGDDEKEEINEFKAKNYEATKYSRIITPTALQLYLAKDDEEYAKVILSAIGSRYGMQDDGDKLIKNAGVLYQSIAQNDENKSQRAWGVFGEYLGGKMNLPYAPARLIKNSKDIAKELAGVKSPKPSPSRGFIQGFTKNGVFDVAGFRDGIGGKYDILYDLDKKSLSLLDAKKYTLESKDWGEMKVNDVELGESRVATKAERDIYNKEYNDFIATYLKSKAKSLEGKSEDEFKAYMSKVKEEANSYAKYKATGEVENLLEYTKDGVKIAITSPQAKRITNLYKEKVANDLSNIPSVANKLAEEKHIPFEIAKKLAMIKIRNKAMNKAKDEVLRINK